jgi:hypothetical protein
MFRSQVGAPNVVGQMSVAVGYRGQENQGFTHIPKGLCGIEWAGTG